MKPDVANSRYREETSVQTEFNRSELRKCRYLLRRLRFLETKIAESGGMANPAASGGAAHAEMELEALEYVLTEVGFIRERQD
jgi:hypothetical protein